MNLGGIMVSSAEIERALNAMPDVIETAAIAVPPPGGGPSLLVVFAVLENAGDRLQETMQQTIRRELNPLFKIHEAVVVESLPRTASNKVMRRILRERYGRQPREHQRAGSQS
jgi:acetyl-CoA synthetase